MDIENSLKITSIDNSPNIDRYSLYIKHIPLNKINDFLLLLNITDKILYDKLYKLISKCNYEIIYGIDPINFANRLYLNVPGSKTEVLAYEWYNKLNKCVWIQKKYVSIQHDVMWKLIINYFSNHMIDLLLKIIPIKLWDYTCVKYVDDIYKPCSFYFSFICAPYLKNVKDNILLLIKHINSNVNMDVVEHWLNKNESEKISWIMISNKKYLELSIYIQKSDNPITNLFNYIENKLYKLYD